MVEDDLKRAASRPFLGRYSKKRLDLLLAEELPTVPAVVAPLGEGEANRASGAAVHHLVLHPVVARRAARLVADRPAEDSTATVAHQDLTVVPEDVKGEKIIIIIIQQGPYILHLFKGKY